MFSIFRLGQGNTLPAFKVYWIREYWAIRPWLSDPPPSSSRLPGFGGRRSRLFRSAGFGPPAGRGAPSKPGRPPCRAGGPGRPPARGRGRAGLLGLTWSARRRPQGPRWGGRGSLHCTPAVLRYAAEGPKVVGVQENDLRKKENSAFILLILLASPPVAQTQVSV